MVLKSHAKINLTLSVNKKLLSGLHDIQSMFCLINLFDSITIKRNNNSKFDKISFKGPHSKFVKKSNNSLKKILNLLRKNNLVSGYYSVKVFKRIPVFAGFGGGTSNAMTVLKFILGKKLKKELIENVSSKIGSDFKLFLYNHGFLKNLETVIKINKTFSLNFLIIYPKIKNSTKKVYSKVKNFSKKKSFSFKQIDEKKKLINYLANSSNDLQSIVVKKNPIIQKLLIDVKNQKGCHLSRLTGSGSGCYGLFKDINCSKAALKILRKKYPKFWFSIAKTI